MINNPKDFRNTPTNEYILLKTDQPTPTVQGLIRLKFDDGDVKNKAKALIAFLDETDAEVVWVQTHDWLNDSTQHKHFSIETAKADGTKTTRLGITYGTDTAEILTADSNFTVGGTGTFTVANAKSTLNGDLDVIEGNIKVDSTGTGSVRVDRGANTNFASVILTTAATDKWTVGLRSDSTDDIHFRNSGGSTPLKIAHSNNHISMTELPTSDPAVAGVLWNDTGTVKVSAG